MAEKDYIERGALDLDLQNLVREYNRNCESDKSSGAFEALYHLRLAPAADVVEVVRCKDCVHWQRNIGFVESPNGYCFYTELTTNGLGFCSCGERRAK